jgi:hypothetical protein
MLPPRLDLGQRFANEGIADIVPPRAGKPFETLVPNPNGSYLTMSVPLQVYAAEAAAAKKTASAVYKAPPVAYAKPSWTGFYIGANAGGVWSGSDLHWTTRSFGLLPGGAAEAAAPQGNCSSSGGSRRTDRGDIQQPLSGDAARPFRHRGRFLAGLRHRRRCFGARGL